MGSSFIKVSIIVPVYNGQLYLHECIDSIINQSLQEIEIIVVDDGSTDDTKEILSEYCKKDPRIKVITKQNTGYGDSLNQGMDYATGEYVGIVESDDIIPKQFYEKLYKKAISEEPHIDIVKMDYYLFSGNSGNYKKKYVKSLYDDKLYGKTIRGSNPNLLLLEDVHNWTGIYRTDFLNSNNIRHNTTPGASFQDTGFRFEYTALAKTCYFIKEPGYMYRTDNQQSSINNKKKVFCICDEYLFVYTFYKEKGIFEEYKDAYIES